MFTYGKFDIEEYTKYYVNDFCFEKPKAIKEPIVSIPEQSSVEIKMNTPKKTTKRSSKKASTSKAVEEVKIETDTATEQVVETDNTEISKEGDKDTDGTN